MTKLKKIIEHPIIATVIASALIGLFAWANDEFGNYLIATLTWLKSPVSLPVWAIVLIVICFAVLFLRERAIHRRPKRIMKPKAAELSPLEIDILQSLVDSYGDWISSEALSVRLTKPQIQVDDAASKLLRKRLVSARNLSVRGPSYTISSDGRSLVLESDYFK